MADYGEQVLNEGLERLTGTWTYRGVEYDLQVEDVGYKDWKLIKQYAALSGQIQAFESGDVSEDDVEAVAAQADQLDDFSWESEDEENDFVETIVANKLIRPTIDLETTSSDKIGAIVEGMIHAWRESQSVEAAKEEMPIEGNR